MSATITTPEGTFPFTAVDWQIKEQVRAVYRTGTSNLGYFATDWIDKTGFTVISGTEATNWVLQTDQGGGVIKTANAITVASGSSVLSGSKPKFYTYCRVKFGSMASNTFWFQGFRNSPTDTESVFMGIDQSSDATKFYARATASGSTVTIASNIAFTASDWVELRTWSDGTNRYLSVNDETPVSTTLGTYATVLRLCILQDNYANGALIDRSFWAYEQAA